VNSVSSDQIEWAKSYPFDVPVQSYIYARGQGFSLYSYKLEALKEARIEVGGRDARLVDILSASQIMSLELDRRCPVLACGSNASPSRLAQKFSEKLPGALIPVLSVEVVDHCIVHAANITGYGSIPATFARLPGARVKTFVTLLTEEQLEVMGASETLGIEYDRPAFDESHVVLESGDTLSGVTGYINRHGAFLLGREPVALASVAAENVPYARLTQKEVQAAVMTALDVSHPMDHYIAQNIADANLRHARAAELRDLHARPFDGKPLR